MLSFLPQIRSSLNVLIISSSQGIPRLELIPDQLHLSLYLLIPYSKEAFHSNRLLFFFYQGMGSYIHLYSFWLTMNLIARLHFFINSIYLLFYLITKMPLLKLNFHKRFRNFLSILSGKNTVVYAFF